MSDEKPTTETVETPAQVAEVTEVTQEEPFDKERAMATINKLREAEKQAKQDRKELERLKAEEQKRNDAALSETERLTKQANELAAKNAKLEGDILRRDVISETGLPATFADRLKGATKEELLVDAQELAKSLPQLKVAPKLQPTNPGNTQTVSSEAQLRQLLSGNAVSVFDVNHIRANGGGVLDWTKKDE